MNLTLSSLFRHLATFLAGIGGLLLSWHLIAPEQVAAVDKAGSDMIAPLTVIFGAIAACVFRAVMAWIAAKFSGNGNADTVPGWAVWFVLGSLSGISGFILTGCSSNPSGMPIHANILTDYGTIGYSSKSGIDINVNAPAVVDLRSHK